MTNRDIELAIAQCDPAKTGCSTALVAFDPQNGIIPRCHYIEKRNQSKTGAIIIGLNPGRIQDSVEQFMVKAEKNPIARYDAWKKEYSQWFHGYPYYNPIVLLLKTLGIEGHVLWTDLFKCEKQREPSSNNQTIKTCVKKHLVEEITSFEHDCKNYHFFILGRQAHKYFQSDVIDYANICSDETLYNILKNKIMVGLSHPSRANTSRNFLGYLQSGKIKEMKAVLKSGKKGKLHILA